MKLSFNALLVTLLLSVRAGPSAGIDCSEFKAKKECKSPTNKKVCVWKKGNPEGERCLPNCKKITKKNVCNKTVGCEYKEKNGKGKCKNAPDDGPDCSGNGKPIFQDFNQVVYAQSNTLDGGTQRTAMIAFDEEHDGILNLFGTPLYTDNLKIQRVPGADNRLRVKFSLFTYGGVPFDIPSTLIAVEDGQPFVPEVLLFDVGNFFAAPGSGQFGPDNDGIDIGQPWEPADNPNNAFLTWYFADGSTSEGVVPNILEPIDNDPNSLELIYFMLIDESQFAKGTAIGFTLTEDILLL